jgi:hypothetical protein
MRVQALAFRREVHCNAVHAVAQTCRPRSIVEYMAQVTAATAAADFVTGHSERGVGGFPDGPIQRLPEAWPSGAAVELGPGRKERQGATCASEYAGPLFMVERTGKRALGTGFTQYNVLLWSQQPAPFGVGMRHFISFSRMGDGAEK